MEWVGRVKHGVLLLILVLLIQIAFYESRPSKSGEFYICHCLLLALDKFPEYYREHTEGDEHLVIHFVMIGNDFDTAVTDKSFSLAACKSMLLAKLEDK